MMRLFLSQLFVALAAGLTSPSLPTRTFGSPAAASNTAALGRRAAVGTGALAAVSLFSGIAVAYDAIPTVEPDFAAMEKARAERDAVSMKKTVELVKKLKPLEAATSEAEFIPAADNLALWVIGEGSIPDGIGVKNLVARIRLAYDSLPKRGYTCPKTRTNNGYCYSPGKGAELAYEALLKEIRKYSVIQLGDYRRVEFQAF
eukprot:CAMPEP_0174720180 /NCGR_PEP_ID=MMETSP1094-20130205/32956_1 /TAXON_ID=156173 /ORGANISM="Chrysochromulina brevifilum, Strain UTEX LB 985" /LENGTH=201 /DNA_ID=CAMNT_0015920629 /DNA_START=27 /DNA_END=632 /DNA_ORIENTATION=+